MPTIQGEDGSVKPQLEVSNTSGGTKGEVDKVMVL